MLNNTKADAAKAAKAKRDAAKAAKADAAKAATTDAAKAAKAATTRTTRDAATIARNATNFEQYSDRDTAYLRFFGTVLRASGHTAKLSAIHDAGADAGNGKRRNPFYAGSAKATDAGAVNRLRKAGYITVSPDGFTITATDAAKAAKAYNGKAD